MGGKNSIISEEQMVDYVELTYLTKLEILNIFNKFAHLGPKEIENNIHYRFHVRFIMEHFPALKYNPFRDRIFHVFSSMQDEHFSFEDFLDLSSAMSDNCPLKVKVLWAFKIFDFNDDDQISKEDLLVLIDRVTREAILEYSEKHFISEVVLTEMDLQHSGNLSQLEFLHAMTKLPEFLQSFSFKP